MDVFIDSHDAMVVDMKAIVSIEAVLSEANAICARNWDD